MKKNKNKWIEKVILIVCVVAAIAVYMAVPSVHQGMNRVFAMFATGDFTVLRDFVASYGAYAAALSFLLMILQSIIAPLPAFLYLCQCKLIWLVEGSYFILVQCYGRRSNLFLHCKDLRSDSG